MRSRPFWWILAVALVGLAGCKDPETAARQARIETSEEKLAEGRGLIDAGRYAEAVVALRSAASINPENASIYVLMAEAQQLSGNEGAAILSMKQASDLSRGDPTLKKALADLYRKGGHTAQAITAFAELRDQNLLTDPEILTLSRMQAHQGDIDGAFKTLELIQRREPDNAPAKVLEAEILLLKGDEILAANLMDRLVSTTGLADAWLLRARYFLNSGRADLAESDLSQIKGEDADRREVVQLRARVLNDLKRHLEAEAELRKLLERRPNDDELIAQLAESILYQEGRAGEAEELVDQALSHRPRYPRALYVRARALEAQGELKRAAENYQYALKSDPSFAPALSRIWRLYRHRGEKGEAMSALERLFFMGEASIEEKVALAELYADSKINLARGRRLMDEVLRRDPTNAHYRQLRARLGRAATPKDRGPVIIRGGK